MGFNDEQGDDLSGNAKPDAPGHLGHRERLRERFSQGGADAMPDYEMLELLLFRAIPRQDTKPIAKAREEVGHRIFMSLCRPATQLFRG